MQWEVRLKWLFIQRYVEGGIDYSVEWHGGR